MKPLRLKMQAFGSYGKETTIDFEKVPEVLKIFFHFKSLLIFFFFIQKNEHKLVFK